MDWSVIIFSPLSSCHFHYFTHGWILLIGFHDCQYFAKICPRKWKLPQKNFPQKFQSGRNTVFSNLNSLHKNTVPRNRVCSITTGLFFSETNTDAHLVLFENMYFYCTYSTKTKILSMMGTVYFMKSQKLVPSKKNQSALIAKISSCKHKKSPIPKNKLPQKISFHTVFVGKMIGRLINQSQVVIFGSSLPSVQVY